MEIIVNHRQFIHCKVSNSEGVLSWFTAIYASPHPSIRSSLWMEIDVLTATIRGPWLLETDFNAIRFSSEKKKGRLELVEFIGCSISVVSETIFVS